MTRVIRHVVPVDDQRHRLQLNGDVLHVDSRHPDAVELWTYDSGGPTVDRWFQVFGTGHPLPGSATPRTYRGSAIVADGALVWHLFEVAP